MGYWLFVIGCLFEKSSFFPASSEKPLWVGGQILPTLHPTPYTLHPKPYTPNPNLSVDGVHDTWEKCHVLSLREFVPHNRK
jgi:hypothetical protein